MMPTATFLPAAVRHETTTINDILAQIERAVAALRSVAEQVVVTAMPRNAIPLMFERIDFNARRAEEAMRVLRDLSLARTSPATELSQSLTVVVLVADMVVTGHLPPLALGDEEVFRRNIIRAQQCLIELRDLV